MLRGHLDRLPLQGCEKHRALLSPWAGTSWCFPVWPDLNSCFHRRGFWCVRTAVSWSTAVSALGVASSQHTAARRPASIHTTALQAGTPNCPRFQCTFTWSWHCIMTNDYIQPLWIITKIQILFQGRWVRIVQLFLIPFLIPSRVHNCWNNIISTKKASSHISQNFE